MSNDGLACDLHTPANFGQVTWTPSLRVLTWTASASRDLIFNVPPVQMYPDQEEGGVDERRGRDRKCRLCRDRDVTCLLGMPGQGALGRTEDPGHTVIAERGGDQCGCEDL